MSVAAATAPRSALGFDVGSRWVGIAIGNSLSHSARALTVLDRGHADLWERISRLVSEWAPDALLVGEPLNTDGSVQEATRIARRFARQLQARFALPVGLVDERHSSREADRRFAQLRRDGLKRRRDGGQQDALAAAIILERWLDAGMPLHPPVEDPPDAPPPADP